MDYLIQIAHWALRRYRKIPSDVSIITTTLDKSLGTLLRFWGVFQFTQVQPLPSPHKQCWTRVSRIFSEFQLCIGWGRGNCKRISKRMHCFKREPRNDRKIWILQYCAKDFCPGLSKSWFWGGKVCFLHFSYAFSAFWRQEGVHMQ